MEAIVRCLVLLSVFLRLAHIVQSAANFPDGVIEKLQEIADAKSRKINCSVSIALYSNRSRISVAAGITDFASNRSATTSDMYAWGSGTKPLTGASILQLVSQGAFGLDDYVAPLVDPFLKSMAEQDASQNFSSLADLWGDNASAVTVRQCLTMQTGIPDFDTAEYYITGSYDDRFRRIVYSNASKSWSPTELMSLPWVAGHWKQGYSTTNFMILGLILAAKTNARSWHDFDPSSFLPIALQQKLKFGTVGSPANFSQVHGYDRTSYNAYPKKNDRDVWKVGGVFAGWTGADMVGSAEAVAELTWNIYGPQPTILPKEFAKLMAHPEGFYGMATFNLDRNTGQNNKYGSAWGHLGATYGYQSILAYLPAFEFTMAVATNLETDDQIQPAETFCATYAVVAGALLGKEVHCEEDGCSCTQLAPSPPPPPIGSCCWGVSTCDRAVAMNCPNSTQTHMCQTKDMCTKECHGTWCPRDEIVV